MKGSVLAVAASSLLCTVAAGSVHERRHAHELFHHLRRDAILASVNATCGCTTYVTTFYGEPTCKSVTNPMKLRAVFEEY